MQHNVKYRVMIISLCRIAIMWPKEFSCRVVCTTTRGVVRSNLEQRLLERGRCQAILQPEPAAALLFLHAALACSQPLCGGKTGEEHRNGDHRFALRESSRVTKSGGNRRGSRRCLCIAENGPESDQSEIRYVGLTTWSLVALFAEQESVDACSRP